jgi:hypothetical protein
VAVGQARPAAPLATEYIADNNVQLDAATTLSGKQSEHFVLNADDLQGRDWMLRDMQVSSRHRFSD